MKWYKRNPADFIVGVVYMSAEEIGAYQLLLDHQWDQGGRLPKDFRKLARMAHLSPRRFRQLWESTLAEKFEEDSGGYFNARLDREMSKARELSDQRRQAAAARWGSDAIALQADNGGDASGRVCASLISISKNPKNLKKDELEITKGVLELLNLKTGRNFRLLNPAGALTANAQGIIARLRDGWKEPELRAVVVRRCRRWGKSAEMADHLTPATLFRKSNFEKYVSEVGPTTEEP